MWASRDATGYPQQQQQQQQQGLFELQITSKNLNNK